MYNIRTTHIESFAEFTTVVHSTSEADSMADVNKFMAAFVAKNTDRADDKVVKFAIYHNDDNGECDLRMLYTYTNRDLTGYRKDKGASRSQANA